MNGQWYTKKWVAVSLHLLFWMLFFLSPYLLRPGMGNEMPRNRFSNDNGFYYLNFLNNFLRLLLFYANAFLFIPKLAYRKRYALYVMALAGSMLVMLFFDRFFFSLLIDSREHKIWNFFVFNLFPFIFVVISSTAFRVLQDKIRENQRN